MSDVEALDWLDKLLAQDDSQRKDSLASLAATNPALHSRLQRMLASALAPEHSRVLAAPVLEGLASLDTLAMPLLRSGEVLAGYRLIRELGRGGMSVVWLAERADGVVKREVALKMPMFVLQTDVERIRFERERDALASLSHPHVARLYDAGVLPAGQPFIVLEHVDGSPLLQHCDQAFLDVRGRVRMFLQVLAAVEHAHKHLVVHRDIKPSNVLVDSDSQVKLLDFGIAKMLAEGDTPTAPLTEQAGGALTPLYAAPEQLRGQLISTLTDVYSLGVLLHELLTGSLPYRAQGKARASLVEVLETQGRGELPRASAAPLDEPAARARATTSSKLRAILTGDLDTIVGKALRLKPEDRYGSAAHFAEDLRRYLDQLPIAARRPGFWYRTRLTVARHRLAASVAGAGLVLVAGAGAVAYQQHRESTAHERRTDAVRDFMFDLVNDAEAVEGETGEVTGRQMVQGAVLRARRDFGAQPQLQGELLGELGRMFLRLGAIEDAVPVLREAVQVLERQATADDPALNKARVFLATSLSMSGGEIEQIQALAERARRDCNRKDVECAKARAYASQVLSQLASRRGDEELALVESRRAAADIEKAFGPKHAESALAWLHLAMTARNSGHLIEAGDAAARATALAAGLRLRAADRLEIDRAQVVIDLDLGRYERSRDRLKQLLAQPAGPDERALQWRLLATVYVELGEGPAALQAASEGAAVLPAEDATGERPYLEQVRARALAITGQAPQALALIDGVMAQFALAGSAPGSFEMLRAERYRAEFLTGVGRNEEALEKLRQLAQHHAQQTGFPIEHGLVLLDLGLAERRAGNGKASHLAHQSAQRELAKQLPKEHPHIARNAALLGGA